MKIIKKLFSDQNKEFYLFLLGLLLINLGNESKQLLFIIGLLLVSISNILLTKIYFDSIHRIWWIILIKYCSYAISFLLNIYIIYLITEYISSPSFKI